MQLFKKQKAFSQFFSAFLKFISNFVHFRKNYGPHSLYLSEATDCEKLSWTNVLKRAFKEHLSTVSMLKGPKHL